MTMRKLMTLSLFTVFMLPATAIAQTDDPDEPGRHYRMPFGVEEWQAAMCLSQGYTSVGTSAIAMTAMGPGMVALAPDVVESVGPGPGAILRRYDELALTETQIEQLKALQSRLKDLRYSHIEKVGPLHDDAMRALEGEPTEFERFEGVFRKMADEHIELMIQSARLNKEAMDLLEPEQQAKLRSHLDFVQELLKQRCHEMGEGFETR